MTKTRPNIVIFNPDSYRGDVLGHLGNPGAHTPNFDALVTDGAVSYANAFAQNPVCTPSRCSFMTGWYLHVNGHRSMKNMLKPHEPNLLSVLRQNGYDIWWGGKNDLLSVKEPQDYLRVCHTKYSPPANQGEIETDAITPQDHRWNVYYRGLTRKGTAEPWPHCDRDGGVVRGAVDYIKESPADQPFCVFLPISSPHPAYSVEEDFYQMIDPPRLPPRLPLPERSLPALDELRNIYDVDQLSEQDWLEIKRIYYAMCTKVDDLFGMVVSALKERGIYDDTLIVVLSDHGDFAGDYSLPEKVHFALPDCLLRSPFLLKTPVEFGAKAGVRQHLVELVDLCPTIYDLLDIDPGYTCQGHSLLNSLHGEDQEIRTHVFAEVGSRADDKSFVNTDVASFPPESFYALQSKASWPAHRAGSYAIMCRNRQYKYVRRGYSDYHELYDLSQDPGELHNLSGHPEMSDVETEMAMQLLNHFMQTGDVLPHEVDSRKL